MSGREASPTPKQPGIRPARIDIIVGVDRLLDMCRTILNVAGDLVTAAVVDAVTKRAEAKS